MIKLRPGYACGWREGPLKGTRLLSGRWKRAQWTHGDDGRGGPVGKSQCVLKHPGARLRFSPQAKTQAEWVDYWTGAGRIVSTPLERGAPGTLFKIGVFSIPGPSTTQSLGAQVRQESPRFHQLNHERRLPHCDELQPQVAAINIAAIMKYRMFFMATLLLERRGIRSDGRGMAQHPRRAERPAWPWGGNSRCRETLPHGEQRASSNV